MDNNWTPFNTTIHAMGGKVFSPDPWFNNMPTPWYLGDKQSIRIEGFRQVEGDGYMIKNYVSLTNPDPDLSAVYSRTVAT